MKIPIREYFKLLRKYLRPLRVQVCVLALLLGGGVAVQLVNPQILRFFIDAAAEQKPARVMVYAALLYIGLALFQQVLAVAATYISQKVGWGATNALRGDLVAHCLSLDMSFHKARQSGELIERIDGDVTALFNFFSKLVLNVLNNFVLLLGILILLFLEDWRIGVCLTAFDILAIGVLLKIQSVAVSEWVKVREMNAKFFGFIGERISGREDVKANGGVEYVMHRFSDFLRRWLPLQKKAGLYSYSMWMATIGIFAVGNAVAFGIGGYLWLKQVITIGTVFLIFNYTSLMERPLEQIRRQLEDLQRAGASIARINELFLIEPQIVDALGEVAVTAGINMAPEVRVEHLVFEYDSDTPVLRDISFQIPASRVLGVLGRTGSGKTTLARLLVRLYDPQQGEIRLWNRPLREIPLREMRQKVAYVTQDVQLFQGTIRDNLTFFNREISDAMLITALHELGLGQWLTSLPMGLDTELKTGGGSLSAGEAQLLAFVRVFLRDPGLIILDEASSRLDPVTEQLIETAIDKLLRGRTAIIIAHRLQTIQRADDIVILEQGRILEYGQRQKLVADPASHFARLLSTGMEEVLA